MTGDDYRRLQRRREADLLVCRLISDWNLENRAIEEIRAYSMDAQRMARDPSCVSDNLSAVHSETVYFDLQRLSALIREGF